MSQNIPRPVNNALAVLQDRQLTGLVLLEDSPGLVQYDMCVRDVNVNDIMTSHNDRGQLMKSEITYLAPL